MRAALRHHRELRLALQRTDHRSWIVERHGWRPHARARADRLGLAALA